MSYEAALKQRYASVRERLLAPPRPLLRIVQAPEAWPEQPNPAPYDDCVPTAAVLEAPRQSWKDLALVVSKTWSVPVADILSKSRSLVVVRARQELYYRMHHELVLSLGVIGRILGVDHTTVRHGCLQHALRMKMPPEKMAIRPSSFWTEERKDRALFLRNEGWTNREIADDLGTAPQRVSDMFRRNNVRLVLIVKERIRRKAAYAGDERVSA